MCVHIVCMSVGVSEKKRYYISGVTIKSLTTYLNDSPSKSCCYD